ncbi:MAG: LysR family transcriptional regulator [Piscinibacter sp.]
MHSFVTTVDCGSVAEAARRLDLTAPAVTARLKALEDDLGCVLVRRSGRAVKPTAAGLNMLDSARAMLREERDMRALANENVQLGQLRLGTFVSALTTVLPPVLRRMYAQRPNLSVSVVSNSSAELCRLVASGDLDAAVVIEPQFAIPKTCEWRALMEEPLVVVARKGLPRGRGAHALLESEPYIQYDRSVLGGQLAAKYLRQQGITPRTRLEINGLMSIASMVDQGLGISLLPDWSAMWGRGLAIEQVRLPGEAPVRRSGVIWGLQSPHAPIARMFLEHAEALFNTDDPPSRRSPAGRPSLGVRPRG